MFQLNLLLKGIMRQKQHISRKAAPITPEILKDMDHFLNFDTQFDIAIWSLILLVFFLMARKSNMVPNAANQFDAKKQLIRGDI